MDIPSDAAALYKGFKIGNLTFKHNIVRRREHATRRSQLRPISRAIRAAGRLGVNCTPRALLRGQQLQIRRAVRG